MAKKYRTDVKIRIDSMGLEWACGNSKEVLAKKVANFLEDLGITLHQGLDVTIIERTGSMHGKRFTFKVPKHRRGR